jgi:hypothetical protein
MGAIITAQPDFIRHAGTMKLGARTSYNTQTSRFLERKIKGEGACAREGKGGCDAQDEAVEDDVPAHHRIIAVLGAEPEKGEERYDDSRRLGTKADDEAEACKHMDDASKGDGEISFRDAHSLKGHAPARALCLEHEHSLVKDHDAEDDAEDKRG